MAERADRAQRPKSERDGARKGGREGESGWSPSIGLPLARVYRAFRKYPKVSAEACPRLVRSNHLSRASSDALAFLGYTRPRTFEEGCSQPGPPSLNVTLQEFRIGEGSGGPFSSLCLR